MDEMFSFYRKFSSCRSDDNAWLFEFAGWVFNINRCYCKAQLVELLGAHDFPLQMSANAHDTASMDHLSCKIQTENGTVCCIRYYGASIVSHYLVLKFLLYVAFVLANQIRFWTVYRWAYPLSRKVALKRDLWSVFEFCESTKINCRIF